MAFNGLTIGAGQLTASPTQSATGANYLDFNSSAGKNWAQQYVPDLMEKEIERYGNRTLSGFLKMVGAEESMSSDQVIWSEQNRLHLSFSDTTGAWGTGANAINVYTFGSGIVHNLRNNQTVVLKGGSTVTKAIVTNVNGQAVTFAGYTSENLKGILGDDINGFVYGSEFKKGTSGAEGSITPGFTTYANSPIIIKDRFAVDGSDASQLGWVEVADESGTSGYLWYLKAEGETRLRFEDYLEMSVVEAQKASAATAGDPKNAADEGFKGTEGLFAAVKDRGNVTDAAYTGSLGEFDIVLKALDKEGAIEENMLFLNRATALEFDDMLGAIGGGYAQGVAGVGASFGVFNNEADMALNLGFSGFRRGSYDFYKTDWKYLNDASTRGAIGDIDGILIPAGTSTVYDQSLGSNIRRPFLHTRYRSSQADDRRMKSWVTGSVGAATSSLDAMEVHFLSERCLCVQAANNFVLFEA
jgi:hypothetical protein